METSHTHMIRHLKLFDNIRYLATSVSALKGTSFSLLCLGIIVNPITIDHETNGGAVGGTYHMARRVASWPTLDPIEKATQAKLYYK